MLYPLRVALSGIWREKWIHLLSVLSIATGLFLIALAFLFVHNVAIATKKLPERFSVMVFLEDGLSKDRIDEIVGAIGHMDAVKEARYISKEEALEELKKSMEDADYILAGLEENPLPSSIELVLRKGAVTGASVDNLVGELRGMKGVAEVQYGKKLLAAIQAVKDNSDAIGFALISALSAGLVFVCYSTVKILFYRKKEEIETLKLLGATKGFIKAPFLIEGGLMGLAGGAISAAVVSAMQYAIHHELAGSFPILTAVSIPQGILQYQLAAGLLIGVTGAYIAVGRIKF
jgi:cell division transport system permease protein